MSVQWIAYLLAGLSLLMLVWELFFGGKRWSVLAFFFILFALMLLYSAGPYLDPRKLWVTVLFILIHVSFVISFAFFVADLGSN